MTATTIADQLDPVEGGGPLFCYRHPDRETYIRCGRCDRPICSRCAMLGPVGMRCRSCGTPARDPLTHLSPAQLLGGLGVGLAGGTVAALIGIWFGAGLLSILVGFFGGGAIAEAVVRVTGYKRGPMMYAVLATGILGGLAIAVAIMFGRTLIEATDAGIPIGALLGRLVSGLLLYLIAALVGAFTRLR